jgi:hypothetical protein
MPIARSLNENRTSKSANVSPDSGPNEDHRFSCNCAGLSRDSFSVRNHAEASSKKTKSGCSSMRLSSFDAAYRG